MSEEIIEVQGEEVLPENKGEIVVVINPADFGVAVDKAAVIESSFLELSIERNSLRDEYAQVMKQGKTLTSCKQAKELSKRVGKNRTRTMATYKVEKEVYLRGGQFIDALRNRDVKINTNMEEKLDEFAEYFEKIEADRLIQLAIDRDLELRKYTEVVPAALGTMMDDVYDFYLTSAKKAFEDKAELERLAEIARVIEELDKSRRMLLVDFWTFIPEEDRMVNFGQWEIAGFDNYMAQLEQLKSEKEKEDAAEVIRLAAVAAEEKIAAAKKQAELQKELDAAKVIADQKEAALVIERKEAADLLTKQQAAADLKAEETAKATKIAKDRLDAVIAAEKIKSDKLIADLAKIEADKVAAKVIADAKIASDKVAADKLSAAPDKAKLSFAIVALTIPALKMQTEKGIALFALIESQIVKMQTWANNEISKL